MTCPRLLPTALLLLVAAWSAPSTARVPEPSRDDQHLAETILRELVELETTREHPDQTRQALEVVAGHLAHAGFPRTDLRLVNPHPEAWGLVARYRGKASRRPLLAMAHIDVVTADPSAWSFPPFSFGKKDGYYFGRGTQDNKTGVAHIAAALMRLKQEGFVPSRDLIAVITGDEETEQKVIAWLTSRARELIDAEFALNSDGGGGELAEDGTPRVFWVQTSEKLYHSFRLSTSNPGGHSSLPHPDNAIVDLARAVTRIAEYRFPAELNQSSRRMLLRASRLEQGQRASDMRAAAESLAPEAVERLSALPLYNALLRTTCVTTMIEGGHAENALPRSASATVNCRILPGKVPKSVQAELERVVDDTGVDFETIYESVPSPPSTLPAPLLESLEDLVARSWPGVPVVPEMSTGATDGLFVRNAGIPVYGVSGWFMRPSEVRAHGQNEKIAIGQFRDGARFWYRMLKSLSR